jgi:hypothetical protein
MTVDAVNNVNAESNHIFVQLLSLHKSDDRSKALCVCAQSSRTPSERRGRLESSNTPMNAASGEFGPSYSEQRLI